MQRSPDIVGSHVLLAAGRVPNTADLGLNMAGVATEPRSFIAVDDRLATGDRGLIDGIDLATAFFLGHEISNHRPLRETMIYI